MTDYVRDRRRLVPELVPKPLWGVSGANLLPRAAWRRIRAAVLYEADGRCSCCASRREKGMICHELWAYDDKAHAAQLTGLALICPECNLVHHMGRAGPLGLREHAVAQIMQVTGMNAIEAARVIREAFDVWRERSAHSWTVSVVPELLARWPALSVLDGRETDVVLAATAAVAGGSRRATVGYEHQQQELKHDRPSALDQFDPAG